MSAPLVVSIPHRLGREEATRRLKAGLTRAASSVPVLKVDEERWEQDRMIFRVRALGQAASGHLDVADDHVRLEVTLPWLLQRFAEVAQTAIKNRGNLLLTKTQLTRRVSYRAAASKCRKKAVGRPPCQLVGNQFSRISRPVRGKGTDLLVVGTTSARPPGHDPGRPLRFQASPVQDLLRFRAGFEASSNFAFNTVAGRC